MRLLYNGLYKPGLRRRSLEHTRRPAFLYESEKTMTKYRYRSVERAFDPRLTEYMEEQIREHAQEQINADFRDFGFDPVPKLSCGTVRIIIEAAMLEYPELFKEGSKP